MESLKKEICVYIDIAGCQVDVSTKSFSQLVWHGNVTSKHSHSNNILVGVYIVCVWQHCENNSFIALDQQLTMCQI